MYSKMFVTAVTKGFEEVTDLQPLTPCLGVDPGTGDSDGNRHGELEMGRNRC